MAIRYLSSPSPGVWRPGCGRMAQACAWGLGAQGEDAWHRRACRQRLGTGGHGSRERPGGKMGSRGGMSKCSDAGRAWPHASRSTAFVPSTPTCHFVQLVIKLRQLRALSHDLLAHKERGVDRRVPPLERKLKPVVDQRLQSAEVWTERTCASWRRGGCACCKHCACVVLSTAGKRGGPCGICRSALQRKEAALAASGAQHCREKRRSLQHLVLMC
eukprot:361880-Chlamydomonas_euryale.AAC.12